MKVEMIKTTNYNGLRLQGKTYEDIPSDVGQRWISKGIAIPVVEEEVIEVITEDENTEEPVVVNYEELTPKQLFALCKEKKIELEKDKVNGKTEEEKKTYLVGKLVEFDEAQASTEE